MAPSICLRAHQLFSVAVSLWDVLTGSAQASCQTSPEGPAATSLGLSSISFVFLHDQLPTDGLPSPLPGVLDYQAACGGIQQLKLLMVKATAY